MKAVIWSYLFKRPPIYFIRYDLLHRLHVSMSADVITAIYCVDLKVIHEITELQYENLDIHHKILLQNYNKK